MRLEKKPHHEQVVGNMTCNSLRETRENCLHLLLIVNPSPLNAKTDLLKDYGNSTGLSVRTNFLRTKETTSLSLTV